MRFPAYVPLLAIDAKGVVRLANWKEIIEAGSQPAGLFSNGLATG